MRAKLPINFRWRETSITVKFTLAFAGLLALIVVIAVIGYIALTLVRQQTEAAIVNSMEIQRLVLKMDSNLQRARIFERDFFARWPAIGFEEARNIYVEGNARHIQELGKVSEEFRQNASQRPQISDSLRNGINNLKLYISAVNRYVEIFHEAVESVAELAGSKGGVQTRLLQTSDTLGELLEHEGDESLLGLHREMKFLEKDYLISHDREIMRAIFKLARGMREEVSVSTALNSDTKSEARKSLNDYMTLADELSTLVVDIQSLFNELDLQANAVNPVSEKLVTAANDEIQLARGEIAKTAHFANVFWIAAVLISVVFAGLIALILNRSITRNILRLTRSARDLRTGNMAVRADVDSEDELGQLAEAFNSMASQIQTLVGNLESQAAMAQSRLFQAIESISEGFSLYDAKDTFVMANMKYFQNQGIEEGGIVVGTPFENIVRLTETRRVNSSTNSVDDDWLERRIAFHQEPHGFLEQPLCDGRWLQVSEYKTDEGETVSIELDVTDRKRSEETLRRQNTYFVALHETTLGLISRLELTDLLEALITRAGELVDTPHGYIYLENNEGSEIHRHVGVGLFNRSIGYSLKRGEGVAGKVWDTGTSLVVNDYEHWEGRVRGAEYDLGVAAIMGVPLKSGTRVIGVLGLAYDEGSGDRYSQEEVELLSRFGELASLSLDNARLYTNAQTSTRQAEKALKELELAQETLIQSAKMASLGQLTAGIAHEIKNPLNFVNNFSETSVELLEELKETFMDSLEVLGEKDKEDALDLIDTISGNLERIGQHGARADRIVKNMLSHAREGSSTPRLTDLNGLLEESLNLSYHGARAENQSFNVTLERDFDPDVGHVYVYPQEMMQAFLNLISNGFYAVHKRASQNSIEKYEPSLKLSSHVLNEQVEIRIWDNGTGIPPTAKKKIFDAFYTTKPAGEGTGLGLSLSYDIVVKQHHGTLDVKSQEGEYTEIILTLPKNMIESMAGGATHVGNHFGS